MAADHQSSVHRILETEVSVVVEGMQVDEDVVVEAVEVVDMNHLR